MTLGEKQKLFAKLVPRLIDKAHELGFEVTLGDSYRDPRSHGKIGERIAYGNKFSCHKIRLAIDLNIFENGVYLTTPNDKYRELCEWWEKQHPDSCSGIRFDDANHFSMTHEGMK